MAKISEETKNDVSYYASQLDLEYYCHNCNSRKEVDAVDQCVFEIDHTVAAYAHALGVAPTNSSRTANKLTETLKGITDQSKINDILMEWEAVSPPCSGVKGINDDLNASIFQTLKDAGIGNKRSLLIRRDLRVRFDEALDLLFEENIETPDTLLQQILNF